MLYLLQPDGYKTAIKYFLEKWLTSQSLQLETLSNLPHPSHSLDTYFIINDAFEKEWSALELAANIRKKQPLAKLILLTNQLDYTRFFRSHIGFLAVIALDELETELPYYLEELK